MKTNRQIFTRSGLATLGVMAAFVCGLSNHGKAAAAQGTYHLLKEIPVGGEGSWDYLSVDTEGKRLYVSHGTKVVVIDLEKDAVAGEIDDTPGVHGVAIAAKLGRGFVSNGRENKVSIVELKTLKTLSKVDTGGNPDAILFEPGLEEVYAFNGRSASATVIEAKSGKVVTTIDLAGKPEFAAADPKAGRVYCNLEDKSEVAVIDTKTHQVVNRWPIAPGQEASGMAFDPEHHRLFLGCGNKLMVMMDSTNGKVVANVPIGDGVDANSFDPGTQLAFASCGGGEGTVIIAHEDAPDKLAVVQTLKTEPRAKTMTLDPTTHKIYLGSAKFEAASGGARRPSMVPGTFKVLVYGMEK
ncbi:MAG TPA: cytochrome D1 domain-containing protein [Candidatus Binatia bacterium]|nr:cytochrome D1 domain-containing protein [Candidatus Binatia bacterium]